MPSPYKLLSGPSSHLATLSSAGLAGNLLFTTDTQQVYVGTGTGTGVPAGWILIGGAGSTGVAQIEAGLGISVSPPGGTGVVTVTATGGVGTPVVAENVAGGGTSFTLANMPIAGTLQLFNGGSAIWPGVDYTILGDAITMLYSVPGGSLWANYQY